MRETIDMIIGTTIGAIILFYIFGWPILWFKRRFFYEKIRPKNAEKLFDDAYYDFVVAKIASHLSREQLSDFVTYEYENFKSQNFRHSSALQLASPAAGFASDLAVNLGRKKAVAKKLAAKFKFLDTKQALKLIRLEEKYLRRFYPVWRRLI